MIETIISSIMILYCIACFIQIFLRKTKTEVLEVIKQGRISYIVKCKRKIWLFFTQELYVVSEKKNYTNYFKYVNSSKPDYDYTRTTFGYAYSFQDKERAIKVAKIYSGEISHKDLQHEGVESMTPVWSSEKNEYHSKYMDNQVLIPQLIEAVEKGDKELELKILEQLKVKR